MISAGINTVAAAQTFFRVDHRNTKKMHIHRPGRADPDAGEIFAGSAIDKLIYTFMKGAHGHATMLLPACSHTHSTSSAGFFVLLNMHCHSFTPS
jgi:hypothetical protein